jgi:hypothetical protein
MDYVVIKGELYKVDELYHHGIKGQKWGVRRFQNKDGTLTAAGKARKSSVKYGDNKTTSADKKSDRDHSKSNKTEAGVTAAWLIADILMLNPVGLVQDSVRLAQAGHAAIKTSKFKKDREGCEVDKNTGLLLKKKTMSSEEDRARVNPSFRNFDANTKSNCMLCTSTYDLRRRGYEVTAKKASTGYLTEDIKAWYPKAKIEKISDVPPGKAMYLAKTSKETIAKVKDSLIKQGEGARGNLMISWKGTLSGHSVAYEVTGGQLNIIDSQANKTYKNPDSFLRQCNPVFEYARLDNVAFSKKNIKEVAE